MNPRLRIAIAELWARTTSCPEHERYQIRNALIELIQAARACRDEASHAVVIVCR